MWLKGRFYRTCDVAIWIILFFAINLIIFVLPSFVDMPTAALIGLTFTTITIMIWQTLREAHEIVVLPNITVHGVPREAGTHAYQRPRESARVNRVFAHWALRRPSLRIEEFEPMDHYVATFDIGNVGLHDVTVHEYVVIREDPPPAEKIAVLFPLVDYRGRREVLRCGERTTERFVLGIQDDCLTVYRIDITSVGREASRRLYVLKQGDRLQYFDAARRIGLNREKIERTLRLLW